ncbi:hypothetical protein [Vibrio sp. 10N.261.51.F12]|uniref:hypothetical protein n=1 Tax=Vibrio sp. 10N.261.51.F12 TaxID=3229679 RepID=UPI003553432A
MQQQLEPLFFIITLITVLLFSHIVDVIGSEQTASHTVAISQQGTPDFTIDTLILRHSNSRVLSQNAQPPAKARPSWSSFILTLSALHDHDRFTHYAPSRSLTLKNNRIAGWQDGNLLFRFIHSR